MIHALLEALWLWGALWLAAAVVACTFFCILFRANHLDEAEQSRRSRADSSRVRVHDVHSSKSGTSATSPAVFDLEDVEWAWLAPYGSLLEGGRSRSQRARARRRRG
jgi:hypothetical protein